MKVKDYLQPRLSEMNRTGVRKVRLWHWGRWTLLLGKDLK